MTGPVVFAGYGIVVPESQDFGYDSYATLDVKDKIVVVLRYFPEDADPKTSGILARYADLRYKAMAARQHGAKAMLVVTGPRSPNAGELVPMTFDTALAGSGIVAASISGEVADGDVQGRAGQDARRGAEIARHRATRTSPVSRCRTSRVTVTRRSCARSGPATTSSAICRRPRRRRPSRSRGWRSARTTITSATAKRQLRWRTKDDAGKVHSGADDNASGSAAVLAIGGDAGERAAAAQRAARASGPAKSSACSDRRPSSTKPPVPLDQLAAYLNFDMVGRMQDNKLTVQATGTSPAWAQHHRAGERRGRVRSAVQDGSLSADRRRRPSTARAFRA